MAKFLSVKKGFLSFEFGAELADKLLNANQTVLKETEKAYLIEFDADEFITESFVPKSQCIVTKD